MNRCLSCAAVIDIPAPTCPECGAQPDAPPAAAATAAGEDVPLKLEFRGEAREYFRIWVVNLCLTLLTLGIFSAWAKVRKKRYFYSSTVLDGTPFQYLGQPVPILKGRLVAAVLFGIYYLSSHVFVDALPYVLVLALIAAPWVVVRSAAFNARYSAYRNMTFSFEAGYREAAWTLFAWGLLPLAVAGMAIDWFEQPALAGGAVALFGIAFPWWLARLKRFLVGHTAYGGCRGELAVTGWQFYKIYFRAGLVLAAAAFASGLLVFGAASVAGNSAGNAKYMVFLAALPMYAAYVVGFAYSQSRTSNLVWNNTRLGPLRFESTLRARGLAKLYLTNALAILGTAGLAIPWAVMRTLKYRADNLRVLRAGPLSEFVGGEVSAVQAAGAEVGDFFDLDLSL